MSKPGTRGRMINTDISNSDKFASLSPHAAVLFCMLIPHFNSYGKLNGGPGYIKDEICPKVPYLTYENLSEMLAEISEKTNVKWFEDNGRRWIHSVNFLGEHQKLPTNKLGQDLLPTYSGPDLEQLQNSFLEVEVRSKKLEVEVRKHPSSILSELFAEFWSAYPKKIGKGAAEKAFKKIKPSSLLSTRMIQAIEQQRESKAWKKDGGQFIPNPSTWLNQKRWEDDLQSAAPGVREQNHQAAREFCDE